MRARSALIVAALVALFVAGSTVAPVTVAVGRPDAGTSTPPDEVSPEEDDPDGCTKATGEETPQCGAQGRQHFDNEGWQPPIEACADRTSPTTGSRITRVLPNGPRNADGSMAFVPGVCVYLPPGYGLDPDRRYPTVYLLHGGGGDQADWVSLGGVQEIFDAAAVADPADAAIAVMPDGRSGMWFDSFDGAIRNETYVLRHVVPYIDRHFATVAGRDGRAIVGLSNGGYGALHLAAKAPDLFSAAGSMSGNVGARAMGGLGTPVADGITAQEAGPTYYGSVPIELVPNLDHVDLVLDLGTSCVDHLTAGDCGGTLFDHAFLADNRAFDERVRASNHVGRYDYAEGEGGHTWLAWTTWLRERHLPFVLDRLADPTTTASVPEAPPAPFRYRSIRPSFSVHGYGVEVAARPATEFLDLAGVSPAGFSVRGSGQVTVTTAAVYRPLGRYVVDGAVRRADRAGRLRVPVDLGPGHTADQYSPAGRLAELAPGYWTERTVAIRPVG